VLQDDKATARGQKDSYTQPMDLERLRRETRPEHEATEATLSITSPTLTLREYRRTLERFLRVMQAWETWSHANAPVRLQPLLAVRRRTPLLMQDLAALAAEADASGALKAESGDAETAVVKAFSLPLSGSQACTESQREAAFLGALYVVEGSTLGGQYIARHLQETLGLTPAHGAAFFSGHGAETGRLWNEVKAELVALDDAEVEIVIQAAKATFGFFRSVLAQSMTQAPIMQAPITQHAPIT
jgi:heme oxygenase